MRHLSEEFEDSPVLVALPERQDHVAQLVHDALSRSVHEVQGADVVGLLKSVLVRESVYQLYAHRETALMVPDALVEPPAVYPDDGECVRHERVGELEVAHIFKARLGHVAGRVAPGELFRVSRVV